MLYLSNRKPNISKHKNITEFWFSFDRYLLKNPVFMLIALARSVEEVAISGFSTFYPKILANQFNISNFNASIVTGELNLNTVISGPNLGI